MSAIEDAIADAKAALAQANQSGGAAPVPGAMVPGGAIDTARNIEARAIAGTLPTEAQLSGTEAPAGEPGYGMTDAVVHGLTLGGSDLASGYMRDAVRKSATAMGFGLPEDENRQWGRGAEEYQAARERYAANNPVSNFAGNMIGGVMMPLGRLGKVGEYIAPYATQLAERLGISAAPRLTAAGVPLATRAEQVGGAAGNVLGGAALGGGMGAIGGAIDEFPEGRAAMLDAALKGGVFGAGVGAAAPLVIGTGLGAYRLGRDYLGPQSREAALSSGAAERALQGSAEDLTAARANYDNSQLFPGFDKSLAQATRDPGLTRREGDLVAQISGRDPSTWTPAELALTERPQQQKDAATAALRTVADPNADPLAVKTVLTDRYAGLQQGQAADLTAAQQALEQQRLALGQPAREIEQLGTTAKAEMQAGKTAGKEAIVGRPERPDMPAIEGMANVDPQIPLNNKPVADQAVAIQKRILPEDRAPTAEEQALFDKAKMWGTSISFERTNALRSDILQTIREQVGAGNANSPMVARLTELRGVIDKNIENQLPADQFAIWRARQDAFRQQAEIYKNRDTGPLLAGREAGDYRVSETATPGRIIRDNQSAQAFLDAGGTPETLRTALITDLHSQGELTPARLDKWRQDREGALRAVPGLDAEVSNLGRAQATLDTLAGTQADQTRAFQQGRLGEVLKADPADVSNVIGSTLSARDAATQMMQMRQAVTGDADAEAGLAKAAVDHVVNRFVNPQTGVINQVAFRKFMQEKEGALRAAGVTPGGMQTLDRLVESMTLPPPGTTRTIGANKSGSPSAFSNMFRAITTSIQGSGGTTSNLLSLGTAALADLSTTGGLALPTVLGARFVQRLHENGIRNVNQVLAEAAANPAFGRTLLMANTPQNQQMVDRALQAALRGTSAARGTVATGAFDRQGLAEERTRRRGQELLVPGQ